MRTTPGIRPPNSWAGKRHLIALAVAMLLPGSVAAQGQFIQRTFDHGGNQRSYMLYVPSSYDGSYEMSLVLNYHAFTQGSQVQAQTSKMNVVAEREGFLVAYPQGLSLYNPQLAFNGAGWNIDGTLASHDDVDFSSQLIDHIQADYSVDPLKVHATGYSFGAMMTFTLACRLADRIASFAPVAGNIWPSAYEDCTTDRPVSLMLFHGTDDNPLYEGDNYTASAAASVGYWVRHGNCSSDSVVTELPDIDTSDGSTVVRTEYQECDMGCQIIFYKVIGGGHTWPGGTSSTTLYGNLNRDVDASSVMWEFFSANPMVPVGTSTQELPSKNVSISAYPNPFSAVTTISYDLQRASAVGLVVTDALGRQVRRLDLGMQHAGSHHASLAAAGLATGVYLVRVQSEHSVAVTTIVLTKGQ